MCSPVSTCASTKCYTGNGDGRSGKSIITSISGVQLKMETKRKTYLKSKNNIFYNRYDEISVTNRLIRIIEVAKLG